MEQANITCTATITFGENDYREQLKTLKVINIFYLYIFYKYINENIILYTYICVIQWSENLIELFK